MKNPNFIPALAIAVAFTLAAPSGASASEVAYDASVPDLLQGQGQGQGRSDEARGNENRGNAQPAARGNRDERGNSQGQQGNAARENRGKAQGNQGNANRGNAQAAPQRGNSPAARGNAGAPGRSGEARGRRPHRVDPVQFRAHVDRLPASVRRFADSSRRNERFVGLALARASMRGADPARFKVDSDGSRVRVRNQNDAVLFDMTEARARELGHWQMRRLGDRQPTSGSPAFCRSGAGHPVWGREWCLDKGFGLGTSERSIWSRASIDDVIFKRRPDANITLDRGGLIDVLGDIVFGRLALQSLAMGNQEPLVGRWVHSPQEPQAPWLLRVHAGDVAVAEFVDTDRDGNVEVLYVTQPRW